MESGTPSYFGARDEGTAVMYDVGKGLIAGGNRHLPTATARFLILTVQRLPGGG